MKKLIITGLIVGFLFYTGVLGKVLNNPKVKKVFSGVTHIVLAMGKSGIDAGMKEVGIDDPAKRDYVKSKVAKGATNLTKDCIESFKKGYNEGR